MNSTILVTGGLGYIGSHTVVELCAAGYDVVIIDNLCNSHPAVLPRLEAITGRKLPFIQGDVRDVTVLNTIFTQYKIDGVIHFAALKSLGESVEQPLRYYENNLVSTFVLLEAMRAAQVKRFVFSSSAAVYGIPDSVPVREDAPLRVSNPYGRTKLMTETILNDLQKAEPDWQIAQLRYFNPVGAHASGTIGEDPQEIPNNLMPYITQVAVGKRECLSIFGKDYDTVDGTGVRDYIHVVDLARGHVAALNYLRTQQRSLTVNLGTGRGVSVLQLVHAFIENTGQNVPYQFAPRRPADVASCYADARLAEQLMGWRATHDVNDMCRDAWRWQMQNPNGFAGEA